MQRELDPKIWVSGQIKPEEMAGLAAAGVTMIVNNRPDYEDEGQPTSADIEAAAKAQSLDYRHIPIWRGLGPAEIKDMGEAIDAAGDGKILAFCRSGNRSALASALAQRERGMDRVEVEQRLAAVGVDPAPIQHLL
jgi:uncharacterized protein (TIGR01244 family)